MAKKQTKKTEMKTEAETGCNDRDCPLHGNLKTHGRTFKGLVVSKHDKRIAIEMERMIYVKKYERYSKKKTKIHARLPKCMEKNVNVGDLIKVKECRPLSKIIHFVFLEKVNSGEEMK